MEPENRNWKSGFHSFLPQPSLEVALELKMMVLKITCRPSRFGVLKRPNSSLQPARCRWLEKARRFSLATSQLLRFVPCLTACDAAPETAAWWVFIMASLVAAMF